MQYGFAPIRLGLVVLLVLIHSSFGKTIDAADTSEFFSGHWEGSGTVNMYIHREAQGTAGCSAFRYSVKQTKDSFTIQSGYFHCGAQLEINMGKQEFRIESGKLLRYRDYKIEQVGTISNDSVQIYLQTGDVLNAFDIKMEPAGQARYAHLWTDGYSSLLFNAALSKR